MAPKRSARVSRLKLIITYISDWRNWKLFFFTGRKAALSLILGLTICLGHCLARAAHVYTFHNSDEVQEEAHDNRVSKPAGHVQHSPSSGGEDETSPTWLRKVWKFLILSRPEGKGPKVFLHRLLLVALLLSIVCAFILNSYFPDEYRSISRGEIHTALIQSIIPTLQVLAVAVACATIEHFPVHSLATGIYLLLFILWDIAIVVFGKLPPEDDSSPTAVVLREKAIKFKARVKRYFAYLDFPLFIPFWIMFFIVPQGGKDMAEILLTGVLCAQALVAASAVVVVVAEDFGERRNDQRERDGRRPSPPELPAQTPDEPLRPTPRLGSLAALVLLGLAFLGGGRRR